MPANSNQFLYFGIAAQLFGGILLAAAVDTLSGVGIFFGIIIFTTGSIFVGIGVVAKGVQLGLSDSGKPLRMTPATGLISKGPSSTAQGSSHLPSRRDGS